jgi:hypothetical protein
MRLRPGISEGPASANARSPTGRSSVPSMTVPSACQTRTGSRAAGLVTNPHAAILSTGTSRRCPSCSIVKVSPMRSTTPSILSPLASTTTSAACATGIGAPPWSEKPATRSRGTSMAPRPMCFHTTRIPPASSVNAPASDPGTRWPSAITSSDWPATSLNAGLRCRPASSARPSGPRIASAPASAAPPSGATSDPSPESVASVHAPSDRSTVQVTAGAGAATGADAEP